MKQPLQQGLALSAAGGALKRRRAPWVFLAQYRKGVVWVSAALLLFLNVTKRQVVLLQTGIRLPGCETIH